MRFACVFSPWLHLGIVSSLALDLQWTQYGEVATPTRPSNSSWFSLPTNTDVLGPTASATCDGDKYGYGLSRLSCTLALIEIPRGKHEVSFGQRHTGAFVVGLPYFFMGSKREPISSAFGLNEIHRALFFSINAL